MRFFLLQVGSSAVKNPPQYLNYKFMSTKLSMQRYHLRSVQGLITVKIKTIAIFSAE